MKALSKILSVFINLANYGVGIVVAVILLFKKDFVSIFYINGMTSNESLFFNMIIFVAALALTGIVLCLLLDEYKKSDKTVDFPIIYEIIPLAVSVLSIVFAFKGDTVREKVVVIFLALLYSLLSAVIIYTGSRAFRLYDEDKK